jgi:O-antigen/teichoic acid export membrane protein
LRLALSTQTLPLVWPHLLRTYVLLAAIVGMGFAFLAPSLIALVYGDALRPDYLLASAVAGAAVFRVIRTPYSQRAIVLGRTGDPARANLFRALALIPAFACAMAGLPLAAVGCAAALGEAAATFKAHQLSERAPQSFASGEKFA